MNGGENTEQSNQYYLDKERSATRTFARGGLTSLFGGGKKRLAMGKISTRVCTTEINPYPD